MTFGHPGREVWVSFTKFTVLVNKRMGATVLLKTTINDVAVGKVEFRRMGDIGVVSVRCRCDGDSGPEADAHFRSNRALCISLSDPDSWHDIQSEIVITPENDQESAWLAGRTTFMRRQGGRTLVLLLPSLKRMWYSGDLVALTPAGEVS